MLRPQWGLLSNHCGGNDHKYFPAISLTDPNGERHSFLVRKVDQSGATCKPPEVGAEFAIFTRDRNADVLTVSRIMLAYNVAIMHPSRSRAASIAPHASGIHVPAGTVDQNQPWKPRAREGGQGPVWIDDGP